MTVGLVGTAVTFCGASAGAKWGNGVTKILLTFRLKTSTE